MRFRLPAPAREIVLGILLLAVASAWSADGSEAYCNPRFDFCLDVPAGLTAAPAPDNGDGRTWKGPGGSDVRAWGMWNAAEETLAEACVGDAAGVDSVTLRKTAGAWCVVSGFRRGRIVYRRRELSQGRWVVLALDYPASQRGFFDGRIGRIVRSLRIGPAPK